MLVLISDFAAILFIPMFFALFACFIAWILEAVFGKEKLF
jgi:hypothetical protein